MNDLFEHIIDLLTEFDEMGFAPTTTVPNPEAYAIKWRDELTKALIEYRKQSEGEWVDNHCTNCGMTPIGDETWTRHGETPPRFELFMGFCPICGAKMKGV